MSVCTFLHSYQNACEIGGCIENITGLASDSASPTDTWILNFRRGTMYKGKNINSAFLKWWADPSSPLDRFEMVNNQMMVYTPPQSGLISGLFRAQAQNQPNLYPNRELQTSLLALNYELNIYREIIKPLIELQICPNFVRYIASSDGTCTLDNMSSFLHSLNNPLNRLGRSLRYMLTNINGRPSINSNVDLNQNQQYISTLRNDYKFRLLITESMENSSTWHTFVDTTLIQTNDTLQDFLVPDQNKTILKLFFQILVGCLAMNYSNMTHKDLHSGNVFITPRSNNEELVYIIDGNAYRTDLPFLAKIYDFDRAYVQNLGENPDAHSMELNYTWGNILWKGADMMYALFNLNFILRHKNLNNVARTLATFFIQNQYMNLWENFYNNAVELQNNLGRIYFEVYMFSQTQIIHNIGTLLNLNVDINNVNITPQTYIIDQSFFGPRGEIVRTPKEYLAESLNRSKVEINQAIQNFNQCDTNINRIRRERNQCNTDISRISRERDQCNIDISRIRRERNSFRDDLADYERGTHSIQQRMPHNSGSNLPNKDYFSRLVNELPTSFQNVSTTKNNLANQVVTLNREKNEYISTNAELQEQVSNLRNEINITRNLQEEVSNLQAKNNLLLSKLRVMKDQCADID